jgi:phospholipase C
MSEPGTAAASPTFTPSPEPTPTRPGCVPGWDMIERDNERRNTHLWIVNRSIDMVATLNGPQQAAGRFLKDLAVKYVADLHLGIWDADFVPPYSDLGWAHHFYDPDTGSNFLSCTLFPNDCRETALIWGVKTYNESLAAYAQNDVHQAVFKLGVALHFLTDVGQPMHAANFTAFHDFPGYHGSFETAAMEFIDRVNPPRVPYVQTIDSSDPGDYIKAAARLAKARADIIDRRPTQDLWKFNPKIWHTVVDPQINGALKDIRQVTAQFLLLWTQQVLALLPGDKWTVSDLTAAAHGQAARTTTLGFAGQGTPEAVFQLDGRDEPRALVPAAGGGWSDIDLARRTGAPPADPVRLAASPAPLSDGNNPGAFMTYLDPERHIHVVISGPGGPWMHFDLTEQLGLKPVARGLLAAYATSYQATQNVAYVDDHGHIHVTSQFGTGVWQDSDVTALSGAPFMDGPALAAYAIDLDSSQAVVYTDAIGHVHEISGSQGGGWWIHLDLTVLTACPPAYGKCLAATFWYTGTTRQVAFVVKTEGVPRVAELASTWQQQEEVWGPWTYYNISAAVDAPAVDVAALAAAPYEATYADHVVFLGSDGHVHDLRLGGGGWTYVDLTKYLQAPLAAGTALALGGSWQQGGNRFMVLYTDGFGHVRAMTAQPIG